MSKQITFTNGLLTNVSGSSLSIGIAPKKYTWINGILTKVEDAGGLSRTQVAMNFVNGLFVGSGSFTSGSSTPPPPPTEIWVAAGLSTNDYLAYSTDGINWTGLGKSFLVNGICWNGSKFVAVGNSFHYSTDGINWSSVYDINSWYCVAWNGTRFVAGGFADSAHPDRTFADSLDGVTWHIQSSAKLGTAFTIAWNGSMFVAGGHDTYGFGASYGNNMAYSSDGLSWTGLGMSIFNNWCYGIATNGSIWIAVGGNAGNTIAYSYNGVDWTGLGNSIFSVLGQTVCWNGNMFVASGTGSSGTENKIAYSYNGIDWVGLGNPLSYGNNVQNSGYCLNWDGTKFLIGSGNMAFPYTSLNTLGYSYDGINWFGLGINTFTQYHSIASNIAPALIPPV
jgi:hypothetical protein